MYVSCFLVGNKPPQDILKGAQLSASVSKRSSYLTTLGERFIVNFYSAMYDFFLVDCFCLLETVRFFL